MAFRYSRHRRKFGNYLYPDMTGLSFRDRWIYSLYSWWGRFGSMPFSLSDILKRPGRLLICLPSDPEETRKAVDIIPDLIACLGAEVVFVVGEPRSLECCDLADDLISLVPLDQTTRRWNGLPSAEIVDRLASEDLNFAVDLNPRAELLPTVLCLRINAPIRLCLDDPHRKRFFNIHILLVNEHSVQDSGTDQGIPPDSNQPDPSFAGTAAPPGNSPYVRMLRVIQHTVRTPSDPRITT